MPEIEVTAEQAKAIREWANKNGNQMVSGAISQLGSLNIIDGDPLLILNKGFVNIGGVAVHVSDALTSDKVADRMKSEGLLPKAVPHTPKPLA